MVENSLLTSKIDSKTPKLSKNTLAVPAVEIYSFLSNATTFPQEMSNFFWSMAWLRYGRRPKAARMAAIVFRRVLPFSESAGKRSGPVA